MPDMQSPRVSTATGVGNEGSTSASGVPMTDGELIAYMDRELAAAQTTGDISLEREDGLRFYNGHKYGNEKEGRSQVVSRDVMETVEWMMDMLLPMFTSGDRTR